MITGIVTSDLEAYVRVTVRGPGVETEEIVGLVDTGFNGYLSLSPGKIAELELDWSRYEAAELADGQETLTKVFEGEVLWDGQWRPIEVAEMPATPLVGMQLLRVQRLVVDVIEGGELTITPLDTQ